MSLASTSSSVSASILFTRSTSAADTTKRWPKGTAWTCPSRIALFKKRSEQPISSLAAGGKSQSWQERKPRGFWRSFPHYCESAATGALFVQRYDDPQSRLSDELQTTWNDEWRTYAATFAGIGKAWLREDNAGISYFGRPEGLAMSDQVVAHIRQVLGEHGVTGQWDAKLGFVPRPKRLLDYMLLSPSMRTVGKCRCGNASNAATFSNCTGTTASCVPTSAVSPATPRPRSQGNSRMASVRKLKYRSGSSAWQVVWAVFDNSGKRIRQDTKAFSTQKQAKAHKAHVETTIERKRIADPDQHTVRSYLNYWLDRLHRTATAPSGVVDR